MAGAPVSVVNWPSWFIRRRQSRTICLRKSTTRLLRAKSEDAQGMFLLFCSALFLHPNYVDPCSTRWEPWNVRRELFGCGLPRQATSTCTLHRLTTTSCSKEDEDVLKAEYLINPKPDRTARLEIVTKVALGEKEVQVRPPILLHVTSVRALANTAL